MIELVWSQTQNEGFFPVIRRKGQEDVTVIDPIEVKYFRGGGRNLRYQHCERTGPMEWTAESKWNDGGYRFTVRDRWSTEGRDSVTVARKISADREDGAIASGIAEEKETAADDVQSGGIRFRLGFAQMLPGNELARFHAPAVLYEAARIGGADKFAKVYMDDRLTYPIVLAYFPDRRRTVSLSRVGLATFAEPPARSKGDSDYLQRTDIGSIGCTRDGGAVMYEAYLPYYEGDRSVSLSAKQAPVAAFYPLVEEKFKLETAYELRFAAHDCYADAVFDAFKRAAARHASLLAKLPFSLKQSMAYRMESLKASYRELPEGGAGFFFHFDPRKGYRSAPSGFGASFVNIPHESYQSILEYGFTGRQINAAYETARREGGEWWSKGKKVIDFFVRHCTTENGWMYTLYDLKRHQPFYSFGDETAPKLHYVSHGDRRGNYLRLMSETALDLLNAYRVYEAQGKSELHWIGAASLFAGFLLRHQNDDGSWYRAFEPDGTPLKNAPGFGEDEFSAKSATVMPILFLLAFWEMNQDSGKPYLDAAKRAAEFVLDTYVSQDYYQGGTLDNPNVIDKEAAQYTAAALYALYRATGKKRYLQGADRAAKLFVTWNYIWCAPTIPGTDLAKQRFNTIGCGGINSIWGGGVVDIYSLFHLRELHLLGIAAQEPFYVQMAEWIATGTQQFLSYPGDSMGFADIGMQPEGFGICNQGADEGMIAKGDIWGTLGWIYSAGIHGLGAYLEALVE
ncbi:hypothetical protein [Paenibacillus macerans]|uniref:hypothetical protein n=1 Tax=Paenibacillus macerans TaxID=44252 RepID=UPI003D313054